MSRPRVAFVYPNPRTALAADVARGEAPDSTLLGQNHLGELGIDAGVHDPLLTRRGAGRLRWNLRELIVPWELRHVDVVFTPLAQMLPFGARPRRLPVVVVNYGLNTTWERSSSARRRLLGASLRAAAAVVCLGESQRERTIEQAGLSAERVHTVRLGIDERYFAPRRVESGREPYILAVGKDLARDYGTLVDAVRPLGVRTEIAAYERNLEGIALPSQVSARAVPVAELRDLYAGAACVVVPQYRDGYPYGSEGGGLTSVLETMAMGRPLVASGRAILRDYVEDGKTALVVPPEDPDALRKAIARVLEDPAEAAQLGGRARERVEAGLTTRHFAEGIAPILRTAARAR